MLQGSLASINDDRFCPYRIVWLDANINNPVNQRKLNRLRQIDLATQSFSRKEELIDYIQQQERSHGISNIILIISGSLSEHVIPNIQNCLSIHVIFIFCTNTDKYQHLKYRKLRAITSDTQDLLNHIEMYIARNNITTDFSILPDGSKHAGR